MIPLEVDLDIEIDEPLDLEIDTTVEAGEGGLPRVDSEDEGKILRVQNAQWRVVDPDFGVNFTTDETLTLDQNNVLKVNTTNDVEQDNTLPITAAGVYTQVGNINALLATI